MSNQNTSKDRPRSGAADLSFLAGGGANGARMREMEWSETPLGPVEEWPQSLKTALSITMSSRFPITLYWGPELVMLYNDALVPMVGANKHPWALARPVFEVLPEVREHIEPLLRRVLETGEAIWSEDMMLPLQRGDAAEEGYFTFTYSPVRDETGGVGGVFCAALETTDKVIEGRRTRLLSALAEANRATTAAEACSLTAAELRDSRADVPFALLYLLDETRAVARLEGAVNVEGGLAPTTVPLGDDSVWPLSLATAPGTRLFVPIPAGPRGARGAAVMPIDRPGGGAPLGFIVAGLSAILRESEPYQRFHRLLAARIAQSVSNAEAREAERKRADALAEVDRAKTTFFSNVSHEFRTPLTLMLGPTAAALASPDRALRGDDLERMYRNALRLSKLVSSLLDFSRVGVGADGTRAQPTDLAALTAGLAHSFESLLAAAGLRLEVDCVPLPAAVPVDPDLWEKVVLNLLSNAYKFTLAGTIAVRLRWLGDAVELSVADTGTGIPLEHQSRVFDRFYRVEGGKGRSAEGSGIGLALVREWVRLHGGEVTLTSEVGVGTTFVVRLPVAATPPSSSAALPETAGVHVPAFLEEAKQWFGPGVALQRAVSIPRDAAAMAPRGRVLLVEDNADMRDYVAETLAERFTVEAVGDGKAALAAAQATPPDVVLSDVMMPEMDGFALIAALEADARTAHVPVVLVSARAGEEATVAGLRAGIADYIVKPFSARELLARVELVVRAARSRAELARLSKEVELARRRLFALVENAPAFVCTLGGPDHVFEYVNGAYQRLVGVGRELLGLPVRLALPEVVEQGFVVTLDRVYTSAEPFFGNEVPVELATQGSDALEQAFVNFVFQPRRDVTGAVAGIDAFGFDVTRQVEARRRAEALSEELKLADRRKDEFLAMLAHELRNPIAAVSLALSLLDDAEPRRAFVHRETARRQVKHLERLVDDLLEVSRITRGKVELRTEEVDLNTVVEHAIRALRPLVIARGHALTLSLAPKPLRAKADPTRLEQVIANLVTNAAKYTEPGGKIAVEVSLDAERSPPMAVVVVRDTGRGIPAAMLESVFEMFVQVSTTIDRSAGGLGIGLTLVKGLVEMHGGTVAARSEGVGHGTELIVRLPLVAAAGALDDDEPVPPTRRLSGARRVVVVEDSDDLREMFVEFLHALGHDVTSAPDGLRGAAAILEHQPHVAFVDVGLPELDGFGVAQRVRAAPAGEGVYLVALTGYGGSDTKAKALAAGFDRHMTKPVDLAELPAIVAGSKR